MSSNLSSRALFSLLLVNFSLALADPSHDSRKWVSSVDEFGLPIVAEAPEDGPQVFIDEFGLPLLRRDRGKAVDTVLPGTEFHGGYSPDEDQRRYSLYDLRQELTGGNADEDSTSKDETLSDLRAQLLKFDPIEHQVSNVNSVPLTLPDTKTVELSASDLKDSTKFFFFLQRICKDMCTPEVYEAVFKLVTELAKLDEKIVVPSDLVSALDLSSTITNSKPPSLEAVPTLEERKKSLMESWLKKPSTKTKPKITKSFDDSIVNYSSARFTGEARGIPKIQPLESSLKVAAARKNTNLGVASANAATTSDEPTFFIRNQTTTTTKRPPPVFIAPPPPASEPVREREEPSFFRTDFPPTTKRPPPVFVAPPPPNEPYIVTEPEDTPEQQTNNRSLVPVGYFSPKQYSSRPQIQEVTADTPGAAQPAPLSDPETESSSSPPAANKMKSSSTKKRGQNGGRRSSKAACPRCTKTVCKCPEIVCKCEPCLAELERAKIAMQQSPELRNLVDQNLGPETPAKKKSAYLRTLNTASKWWKSVKRTFSKAGKGVSKQLNKIFSKRPRFLKKKNKLRKVDISAPLTETISPLGFTT